MGLFSKSPTAVPAARTKAIAKPVPVAITGLGLACHAGEKSRSLISSILGQMSGVELSDTYGIRQRDGSNDLARIAPVEAFGNTPELERMYYLTTNALSNAAAQLSANVSIESVLIVISVAPEHIMHLLKVEPQYLQSYLVENIPSLTSATFRILPNGEQSSSGALRLALDELNEGKWQAIIFGGADSLISMNKCQELNDDNRLNTIKNSNCIIPGEAAAFVVLQSTDAAANNTTPTLAYLSGLGVAAEPHARDADLHATEGLSGAITQALTQAGLAATDIEGLVHNLGSETVEVLEWDQTSKKIWPIRVNEQQRMAVQLGELEKADTPEDTIPRALHPYKTMGEVGAASFPMQLATALAWLEYDAHQARWGFPVRKHLLVCDTPAAPERGALVISKSLASQ